MATFVYTDAFFSIDGVDLSDHVRSASLTYDAEEVDDAAMGDSTRGVKGGLKNWTMEVEFHQDFAANEVDVTLFDIVGTAVTVILRPTSASVGATNPNYTGSALVQSYNPLGGSVGDAAAATLSLRPAGDLSRATS